MSNPMQTHGAFSWMELHSGDSGKAKDFYSSLLGWRTEEMEMPDMTYSVIANGEDKIGGFPPMAADTPRWLPYVTVDDVDARVEKAKSLGATIAMEPFSVPTVGRMATIVDPVGGVIALITYEAPSE
ncbi:VOC family protein [Roseibium sediminicola]|uniref:VOC family protein n=1 Tax=Roseibium sediminicola TaxID=2933272 RepID=A0ABT0GMD4_9HYPH|nr:VOC family protein [Roseibium sp. CAU 1639]MCK7610580.1 VOC family protein [Roseibium sp. CAU 1639]